MVIKRFGSRVNLSNVKREQIYRLFYPQVAMVVCSKLEELVGAMPAVSCISTSNRPPLVALAISAKARTSKIIKNSKKFSINWLDQRNEEFRRLILDLSKPGSADDKLRENHARYRVDEGIPVIAGCCAYALCSIREVLLQGDHDLFIAKVMKAKAASEAFQGYWKFKYYKPSIYVGSNFPLQIRTLD